MVQTIAFVLGSRPHGEADRLYTIFSPDLGKVWAVAKSVRKSGAKLPGHLDFPNRSWVMLVPTAKNLSSGTGQGWQITQALEEDTYGGIRRDAKKFRAALRGATLIRDFVVEAEPDRVLWGLWSSFLRELDRADKHDEHEFLFSQFAAHALHHLGFLPDIAHHAGLLPKARDVLRVSLGGVWMARSSESRMISEFVGSALEEARRHMV